MTYGQLNQQAERVAAALAAMGIASGDHVALSCPNLPWFPIAYYGILKAGAVVYRQRAAEAARNRLPLERQRRESAHRVRRNRRTAARGDGEGRLRRRGVPAAPADDAGARRVQPCSRVPTLSQAMLAADPAPFQTRRRRMDDTAVILYTSGTTGHPKGAELTHANMLLNAVASRDMYLPGIRGGMEQEVALVTLPLFDSTAQTCLMNAGLLHGFRLVLMPRFDPAAVLDVMEREQVGLWIGVPTMYWALLHHVRSAGIDPAPVAKHLRLCVSGGAAMPLEVMREFESVFGARILEGYGLSETSPVASFNQLHQPIKPGTVGQPIFGVEVRCVDDEDRFLPLGQPGKSSSAARTS